MNEYTGRHISFALTGTSRGPEIGITVRGLPKGEAVNLSQLRAFLARRAPGTSALTSARKEPDEPVFLSGITEDCLDGGTLRAIIRNRDARPDNTDCAIPRPGHADYPAWVKYGDSEELAGGGPFSGRMTAPLCILGSIALQILARRGIVIGAHLIRAGSAEVSGYDPVLVGPDDFREMPLPQNLEDAIRSAAEDGDSVGGVVECAAFGLPVGLGGPTVDGLESRIAELVFAIPACKGVSFGAGFAGSAMRGSEWNDAFCVQNGTVATRTNRHGGILGGMASGMPLLFQAAFKPTPSIRKPQESVNLNTMESAVCVYEGRSDPCAALRAVPVVEAAAAIALLDTILASDAGSGLTALRGKIDALDRRIAPLLAERLRTAETIGTYKSTHALPVADLRRESEVIATVRAEGAPFEENIEQIYRTVLAQSKARQAHLDKEG